MRLYRFKLQPLAPWRTRWQADTLAGMLCWACARTGDLATLRDEILGPALQGQPPFVLSDACPGDFLPLPAAARLLDWPPHEARRLAHSHWIPQPAFQKFQKTACLEPSDIRDTEPIKTSSSLHNTISRITGTTGPEGSLFHLDDYHLAKGIGHLTIYARVRADFLDTLTILLEELSARGFGADTSAGRGQFRLLGGPEPADHLDAANGADGLVVLSTFQPGPQDPTDGFWQPFVKYGKLSPDFGLENVFKRPIVLFRPGACFRTDQPPPFLGRAIPPRELLSTHTVAALADRGVRPVHLAFGLAVPCRLGNIEGGNQ